MELKALSGPVVDSEKRRRDGRTKANIVDPNQPLCALSRPTRSERKAAASSPEKGERPARLPLLPRDSRPRDPAACG